MRYLPQTQKSRQEMLDAIGVADVDALYSDVPNNAFIKGALDLPQHMGEMEVENILGSYANQNHAAPDGPFFLGAGTYYHHVPATVDYIIQRSEFLTAYTPYQPEIAQGTLQAIYEFQTMIAQITGQQVANSSLYDGATAMAEAALMAMRIKKRKKVVLGNKVHPHYEEVLTSYFENFRGDAEINNLDGLDDETACVIIQSPDFFGAPHAYHTWREKCDAVGALLVVVTNEILSLGMLPAPAEADIVCGEAQSIGLPMSFGGPHLGFFACHEKYVRQMPGRLCGETVDAKGRRSFVLTLNTREQHIRREKATSNICTNQGLCALAFTVHMALLGEDGFKHLARLNHERACALADALSSAGFVVENKTFFNEFVIKVSGSAADIVQKMAVRGVVAGYPVGEDKLLVCATEMTREEDIEKFCTLLQEITA